MNKQKKAAFKLIILSIVAIVCGVLYMTLGVNFAKTKFVLFSMEIRAPKLIGMVMAAFLIGSASIIFQSIINNTIVTPCLLGMNSLYTLLHTVIVFVLGSTSILVSNKNVSFVLDLVVMGVVSMFVYGMLFKKTKYNVLYILLVGTILTGLFSSIQNTMVRVMDPNEYDTLLTTLVASFDHVNSNIIGASLIITGIVIFLLRHELRLLDVITLGKNQAINLGVDYDKTIRRLLIGVTIFIAIATAMVGPISFLGLIVANLARELLKSYRHKSLIFASVLFGLIVLIGGQILVEHVFRYSIPVSVFITLGGGGYFLYLLLRRKKA